MSKTAQMHEHLKGEHPVPKKERLGAKKRKNTNQKKKKKRKGKKRKEGRIKLSYLLAFFSSKAKTRTYVLSRNGKWLSDRLKNRFTQLTFAYHLLLWRKTSK